MNYYSRRRQQPVVDIGPKICEWQPKPAQVVKSTSSVVIGIFHLHQHLIIAKMNGDIMIVDEKLETPVRLAAKAYLPMIPYNAPSDKTLEYAEIDPVSGFMYFTMASDDGIFYGPLLVDGVELSSQNQAILDFFVRNDIGDREFWGMALDADKRLLYCCNRHGKSSIGAWRLADGQQLFDYGINDSWPFTFLQCCALSRDTSKSCCSLAVSSSPSQRILLFDNCDEGRQCRFVSTVAGKKLKRNSDPLKFVVNPLGMAFDSFGNILVADCGSSRLQIFCPSNNNEDESKQPFDGQWQSDKLASSPRCVAVTTIVRDGTNSTIMYAGLHNGDVVCFKTSSNY